jgi:hypothetical protein
MVFDISILKTDFNILDVSEYLVKPSMSHTVLKIIFLILMTHLFLVLLVHMKQAATDIFTKLPATINWVHQLIWQRFLGTRINRTKFQKFFLYR